MHLLSDNALAVAVRTNLSETLLHHLAHLVTLSRDIGTDQCVERVRQTLTPSECATIAWLTSCRVFPGVYRLPFLSPSYCAALMRESSLLPYEVNSAEPNQLQTSECVLSSECPQLGRALLELLGGALYPVLRLVYGTVPEHVADVHLTRYAVNGSFQGVWHNDEDSDITVLVELNPDGHTGGGTKLMCGPLEASESVVLAQGEALIFPGKTTLHAGVPLQAGVRDLLVYWLETKADA